jgi:hypothetical protein
VSRLMCEVERVVSVPVAVVVVVAAELVEKER